MTLTNAAPKSLAYLYDTATDCLLYDMWLTPLEREEANDGLRANGSTCRWIPDSSLEVAQ